MPISLPAKMVSRIFFLITLTLMGLGKSGHSLEIGAVELRIAGGYAWPLGNLGTRWIPSWNLGGSLGKDLSTASLPFTIELSGSYASLPHKTTSGDAFAIIPVQLAVVKLFPELPLSPFLKAGGGVIFETLTLSGGASSTTDYGMFVGIGSDLAGLGLPVELFVESRYQLIFSLNSTSSVLFLFTGVKF